jgi:hypothetical protein
MSPWRSYVRQLGNWRRASLNGGSSIPVGFTPLVLAPGEYNRLRAEVAKG